MQRMQISGRGANLSRRDFLKLGGVGLAGAGAAAWACFAYVSVVSMFLGFFAWYRGLAEGGVARVGQVQLSQPVLTLLWSALLLGEHVGPLTVLCALLVLGSVAVGQRTRVKGGSGKAAPAKPVHEG